MENTAIILIALALFLLVIVVSLLALLVFKILKDRPHHHNEMKHTDEESGVLNTSKFHPAIQERLKEVEKLKPKRSDLFCPNHSEEPGEVPCAICDKLFCKSCIRPFKSLHFCKEHLPLLMRHEWEEVLTVKTSTHDPEEGVRLYDAKKELFQQRDIPTYVETHYKINIDQDFIETYLVVFSLPEHNEIVKEKLQTSSSIIK